MTNKMEKERAKRLVKVMAVWIFSAACLLCLGALLAESRRWGEAQLKYVSAAVLLLTTAIGAKVMLFGTDPARRLRRLLIYWLLTAALLLTIGFLVCGDRMQLDGLLRVLLSSLCGALLCCPVRAGKKRKSGLRLGRNRKG